MATIKRIYEIQDIGKGVINTLTEDNLLKIFDLIITPNLQEVLNAGNQLIIDNNIIVTNAKFSIRAGLSITGITVSDITPTSSVANVAVGRLDTNQEKSERGFNWYSDKTGFRDILLSKGLEYEGDYEPNFTERSLITKKYVDNKVFENKQKVITSNYLITNADDQYTIFINNGATPITITLDSTVTTSNFCVGFIQEGTADVTFVGTGVTLTNPIGLKIKGQGYQTFIERELSTSTYYLLGNTKV